MLTANAIRQQFIDFFTSCRHHIIPSAPIVVKDDPTLLFTNAGMNPFKDIFLGNAVAEYRRVANTQKCLRVSGKHNDLEEVGVDTYHHTMFEMLGNWSFGDYFKEEAITWAWELLTKGYCIAPDRLWVTVFKGSEEDGLAEDRETVNIWQNIVPKERILAFGAKDNFWEMGVVGPCGPCSEIHIDCRTEEERHCEPASTLINKGHPQVIELWNLVFIEKHRTKDGKLHALSEKHIDTGMGLERLVRVLQQKKSNYDTDIFTPIIREVERLTGKRYHYGMTTRDISFRVIADHLRAIMMCIADGQRPENTGAGYVVKRLLRRATRYYYAHLYRKDPLLYALTPIVTKQMGKVFPELFQHAEHIQKIIHEEEATFLHTIDKGMKRLESFFLMHPNTQVIDGAMAFELYDTYGFPLDVTQIIAKEKQLQVDEEGFEKAMQQQQQRSRKATTMDAMDWVVLQEGTTTFVGYEQLTIKTRILRYRKVVRLQQTMYQYVLADTPFYAERGGQRGDRGYLVFGGESIPIMDTQYENGQILHLSTHFPKDVTTMVLAQVNEEERKGLCVHHTATHLLYAALQEIVDSTATQRGSYITHTGLRFDFSARTKLSEEQIQAIEDRVNGWIYQNFRVYTAELPYAEAIAQGAKGLFGEKYGAMVRVVRVGYFSKELCGGTHVVTTGEMRIFRVLVETSVAAGVRRIEAVCGEVALAHDTAERQEIKNLRALLGGGKLSIAVKKLKEEKIRLEKNIATLTQALMEAYVGQLQPLCIEKEGVKIWCQVLLDYKGDAQQLKQLAFLLKRDCPQYVIFLLANMSEDKSAAVFLIDDLTSDERALNATAIIRSLLTPMLKGGGNITLATAGGKRLNEAGLQNIVRVVEEEVLKNF